MIWPRVCCAALGTVLASATITACSSGDQAAQQQLEVAAASATAAENYKMDVNPLFLTNGSTNTVWVSFEDVNPLFLTNGSTNTVWVSFEDGDQNVEFPPGAKKRARGESAVITGDGGAVLIRLEWGTTGLFDFWSPGNGDGDPYIKGYGASGNRCFRRVPDWGTLPDKTVTCDARLLKLGYDEGENYGSPGEDKKLAAVLVGDNWTW